MPVSKHFGGKGDKIMSEMKKHYGDEKGEKIFFALENSLKKKKKKKRMN